MTTAIACNCRDLCCRERAARSDWRPCTDCSLRPRQDRLAALCDEARMAGDAAQVDLCNAALAGYSDAIRACEKVMADARAMDDGE
jgi:hypothetical protein